MYIYIYIIKQINIYIHVWFTCGIYIHSSHVCPSITNFTQHLLVLDRVALTLERFTDSAEQIWTGKSGKTHQQYDLYLVYLCGGSCVCHASLKFKVEPTNHDSVKGGLIMAYKIVSQYQVNLWNCSSTCTDLPWIFPLPHHRWRNHLLRSHTRVWARYVSLGCDVPPERDDTTDLGKT